MNYAKEFTDMINEFYSSSEIWDDELKIKMLEEELHIAKNPLIKYPPRNTPYFSPSSVNSCPRELYMKLKGHKRDEYKRTAIQGKWTSIGTRVGEELQTTMRKITKHWGKKIGKGNAPFKALFNKDGFPMWEDFAKRFVGIPYKDKVINFYGTGDGILTHSASGKNIGMEVKSKSTTPAQTSFYSMKEEKEDHRMQVLAYSMMYSELDIKSYLICYWNVAKKSWGADVEVDPDLRVFEITVTKEEQEELLERLYQILVAVDNNEPPKLDITKWTFNNFKTACALDLSEEEVEELKEQVRRVKGSSYPQYVKNNYNEAMKDIVDIRRANGLNG